MGTHPACLTIDMSTRRLGWAMGGDVLTHGAIRLPGMLNLGGLYAGVRNALCDLFEAHRPARLVWYQAEFVEHETVWEAHKATRIIAELTAHDNDVAAEMAELRRARITVLGRGDFGERGAYGMGLVAESGRAQAKATVAAWCFDQGYGAVEFEVGNALVLRRYCEILGRKQPNERVHRGLAAGAPNQARTTATTAPGRRAVHAG